MKKLTGIAILAAMVLSIPCQAEEDYEFDSSNCILTDYVGTGGDLVIPDTLQGCPVEMIGGSVFYDDQSITGLTLPETVLAIGNSCIYYNDSLLSVTLPESLIAIDAYNFWSCSQLSEIVIPPRVSFIGTNSFNFCYNLSSVTFTGEVPHIEGNCFAELSEEIVFYVPDDRIEAYAEVLPDGAQICSSGEDAVIFDFTESEDMFEFDAATGTVTSYLGYGTRVDIPASISGVEVQKIGEDAFNGHRYAYYVTIPEGVTEIGTDAFAYMSCMRYVDLPSTLVRIGNDAFNGYRGTAVDFPEGLEEIGEDAFIYADLSDNIVLPEGLKTIGANAFYGSYAREAYFPESLETIESSAFAGSNVEYLYFESKDLPRIAEDAFTDTYIYDVDINWKASKDQMYEAQAFFDSIGQQARVWRMQNPNVIPVDYYNNAVYEGNKLVGYSGTDTHIRPYTYIEDVEITEVGDRAFAGNQTVKYFAVDYSDSFTTIGTEAFADSSLEYIDLFDSVTTIGEGAFRNCVNMKEVVIPESVTWIGGDAFAGCTGMETVTILCDPTLLPSDAFADCVNLKTLYVPADTDEEELNTIAIIAGLPWNKKAVRAGEEDTNVFYSMPYESLPAEDFWFDGEFNRLDTYQGYEVNLYLPRAVDEIPMDLIGGGVLGRAQSYAGTDTVELPVRSVVIPETVKEIAGYAFADCPTLETVICYAPIENLNDMTFYNCKNLREVVFVNGVRNIGYSCFAECPSLETVYLGEFTDTIQEDAFMNSGISAEACIRNPEQMPDAEQLLAAVKSDPIPEPETEAPFELPAFDIEKAQPFIGSWKAVSVRFGSETYAPEDVEMEMELTLAEDGSAEIISGEEQAVTMWSAEEGIAVIVLDGEPFLTLQTGENDTLVYEEDMDAAVIFEAK